MHLPDGFLDGKTAGVAAGFAAAGVALALRQVQRELPARRVPLLGLSAAFLFAAQMINFPVLGGTSGHLLGGVLVAALIGPAAALVVVTTVLIVQCLLFADGGLLALGANLLNMGLIGTGGGYAIYHLLCKWRPGLGGRVAALAFAGWCSTVLAAAGCAAQLAWSGTVPWAVGFTAMVGIHMLIGLGEGLISALVWFSIHRVRPELTSLGEGPGDRATSWRPLAKFGLLASLGLAVFVAPIACPWPDGLETVAARLGFEHKASARVAPAPAPDYLWPGIRWAPGATALAGAAGSVVVFGLAILLGRWLARRERASAPGGEESP